MNEALTLDVKKNPTSAGVHVPVLASQRRFDVPERTENELSVVSGQQSTTNGYSFGQVPVQSGPGSAQSCSTRVQPKLEVGAPDDEHEREADRVAEHVMRVPDPAASTPPGTEVRRGYATRDNNLELTPRANDHSSSIVPHSKEVPSIVHEVLRSAGEPLESKTRAFLEPRFGHDFGHVRVHTGAKAAESARAIGALAFTCGAHVVLSAQQHPRRNGEALWLLAHEMAHVVQQDSHPAGQDHVVHTWSGEGHRRLTMGATAETSWDEQKRRILADESTQMDVRATELWFNIGGWFIGLQRKLPDKAGVVGRLHKYYAHHADRALQHGEGGLYSEEEAVAAPRNLENQHRHANEARQMFNALPADRRKWGKSEIHEKGFGPSYGEPASLVTEWVPSHQVGKILSKLGDALHVAQDRGAHGEGAREMGHAKQILQPGFDPDEESSNGPGWGEAQKNSADVMRGDADMFSALLR